MELQEIVEHLRLHRLWLQNDTNGKRANLSGADLRGANLSGADLKQTLLENKAVLTFLYNRHTAYYFGDGYIQIGCHKKTIAQWLKPIKK